MDQLLGKEAESGVKVAAVWMCVLKCGVGENGGRSYHFMGMIEDEELRRRYWTTPIKNGLLMVVVEARNHCRRNVDSNGIKRSPKHWPAS